ncbi:MAG TPA: SGNH/GDSL hydrolase family protein [Flavobacteriales bacterium]|nr:SGNH/GDSL hydrolase family protein [Flavobacteriales bacterium]
MGALFNAKGKNGLCILAEGDSWFHYPSITGVRNIITHLQKMGYNVKNMSTCGHNLVDMVYGTIINRKHDYIGNQQIDQTLHQVDKLKPDIVLLSGGGNDVCGDELEGFINHSKSGLPILRMQTLDYFIDNVLKTAYQDFFKRVKEVKPDVHFIIHGYAYPPCSGDGVGLDLKSFGFSGPWIKPAFSKNNWTNRQQNEAQMRIIIDKFNAMQLTLVNKHVHHIDLRNKVSMSDWVNELHLKDTPYKRVAQEFEKVIQSL